MKNSLDAITPQQLEAEGNTAYQQGDFSKAAASFAAAQESYIIMGDELKSAEMANNRCVVLLQADEPQAALESVEGTIDVFRQAEDDRRHAMALGNRASALEALGKFDEAITDYQESADLLKKIGADDLRMDVAKSLSALQLKTGRSLEALATMQAGVEGVKKPDLKQRLLKRLLALPGRLMGR